MWVSSDLGMLVEVSDYCQSPDRSQSYLRHMSHETYCSPLTQNLGPMFFCGFQWQVSPGNYIIKFCIW